MFQLLPPPPRFTLPPPPMLPSDLLAPKLFSHLTCSSIPEGVEQQQQSQYIRLYFIVACSLGLLMFTLFCLWPRLSRELKTLMTHPECKQTSNSSICNDRSYESGLYLESINTLAVDTDRSTSSGL